MRSAGTNPGRFFSFLKALHHKRSDFSERNRVSLSNSSRKRPMKDSAKAFCTGSPGAT